MKKLLGLLAVTVSLLVTALVLPLTGCGGDGDSGDDPIDNGIDYTVTVQSLGKRGIPNVTVQALLNDAPVNSAKTDSKGKATLHMEPNEYTLAFSDLPKGYQQSAQTFVTDREATPVTVSLASSVIKEQAPNDFVYTIGDVAYDFTLTAVSGDTYTLSELLETKRAVFLNFWATWCGPCVSEFPALIEAYNLQEDTEFVFKDKLELIAIDPSNLDTAQSVRDFRINDAALPFPTVFDGNGSFSRFFDAAMFTGDPNDSGSIPMTVVIDRYGVICFAHVGSMTDPEDVKDLFDQYTRDDYVQDYEEVTNPGGEAQTEREKPDVDMPASSEIEAAINNTGSGFTFSYYPDENEYSWPWIVTEKDGQPCISPSNSGHHISYAIIYTDVTVTDPDAQVFAFDYIVSTEKDNDLVYVQIDGGLTHTLSGREENDGWKTCYAYIPIEADTFSLSLMYTKNESGNSGDDTIYVRNMRFCTKESVIDALEQSNTSLNFAYHCATILNETQHKYENYVTPVKNENDHYYHVGNANGPLILADLTHSNTRWNSKSIYDYVAEDVAKAEAAEQEPDAATKRLQQYCAYAGNSAYVGYVPVNDELLALLKGLISRNSTTQYDNQWLEICTYMVHYGTGDAPGDPIAGLTDFSAYQAQIGENSVVFDRVIVPRGLKFAFKPEQDGVYTIESKNGKDSVIWIADAQGNNLLYADYAMGQANKNKADENDFRADIYLEAGETYYLTVAFDDVNEMSEFKFTITRAGDSALVVTDCTEGIYTTSPTGNIIIVGIKAVLNPTDNCYYTENGEKIYMDFVNHVYVLNGTIQDCIDLRMFDLTAMGGRDYTSDINAYMAEKDEHGLVAVDKALADIIMSVSKAYDWFFDGVENPWLFLCYYYRYEGAESTQPDNNTPKLPEVSAVNS